jgi:hypothetical protein
MGIREDLTEIKVGVATIVEHQKSIDNRLEDGDKRFDDHSKVIRRHDTAIVEIQTDNKSSSEILKDHSKAFKFLIANGVLTLLAIIGFLIKVIWEYIKTKGLPTSS